MALYVTRPLSRSYQYRDDTLWVKISVAHPAGEAIAVPITNFFLELTGGVDRILSTTDGALTRTDELNQIVLEGNVPLGNPVPQPNPNRVHFRVRARLADSSIHTLASGVFNLK